MRGDLIVAGAALSLPMYVIGTGLHEGSHALVAHLSGATVRDVIIGPTRDDAGRWRLGLTRVRGLRTDAQRGWFYAAPKLTNLVVLGGYASLYQWAWPKRDSGRLLIATVAVGAWVDFSKDVFATHPSNDMMKLWALLGARTESQRWPWRLSHAVLAVGLGYLVWRGVDSTLHTPPALPVAAMRF